MFPSGKAALATKAVSSGTDPMGWGLSDMVSLRDGWPSPERTHSARRPRSRGPPTGQGNSPTGSRRLRDLEDIALFEQFQFVEQVARPAVLRVADHPVQLDLSEHGDVADQPGGDLRLGAEGHGLEDVGRLPPPF